MCANRVVLGVGTDIVSVDRFKKWEDFSQEQLKRVFSEQELVDCGYKTSSISYSGLAVRFAAKEAFFKALSSSLVKLKVTSKEFSLLFLCQHVEVKRTTWDVPVLSVNWKEFENVVGKLPEMSVELSLSHEREFALAFVVVFKNEM